MARNRTKTLCFIFGGMLLLSLFMMSPFYIDMSWKKVNINQDHFNKKYVTLANFLNLNQGSQLSVFIICIYNHRTTKTNQKYPSVNL